MRPLLAHSIAQSCHVSSLLHKYEMGQLKRSPAQSALRPSTNILFAPTESGRQISPGLTTNFPSNNPFRNRAVSPAGSLPSPVTNTFGGIPNTTLERPTSRNPFLDQSEKKNSTAVQVRSTSPEEGASRMAGRTSPSKPALTGHAVDLFVGLISLCAAFKLGTDV